MFDITKPVAQCFFRFCNAHFDVVVEPKCVTESFTPVVLRPKPGELAHGLVRVFDHETGLVLYEEEIHDDSSFRYHFQHRSDLLCSSDLLNIHFAIRIGVSGEFFIAAHNYDSFIDICHLGSEFVLRRLDLPSDWTVNSVQVLEDRLLLLTRYSIIIR